MLRPGEDHAFDLADVRHLARQGRLTVRDAVVLVLRCSPSPRCETPGCARESWACGSRTSATSAAAPPARCPGDIHAAQARSATSPIARSPRRRAIARSRTAAKTTASTSVAGYSQRDGTCCDLKMGASVQQRPGRVLVEGAEAEDHEHQTHGLERPSRGGCARRSRRRSARGTPPTRCRCPTRASRRG